MIVYLFRSFNPRLGRGGIQGSVCEGEFGSSEYDADFFNF